MTLDFINNESASAIAARIIVEDPRKESIASAIEALRKAKSTKLNEASELLQMYLRSLI